jgi:hypothetical protein
MPRVQRTLRVPCTLAGALVMCSVLASCSESDSGDPVAQSRAVLSACPEPPGQVTAPRSVLEVVELLNARQKPITLACFVESLERPLALSASRSLFSAQPTLDERSPRLFVFSDPLIMTLVPEGDGSHLLEFGELRSETRSLKAEIEFPVERVLEPQEAFEGLMYNETLTNCAFCHAAEEPDPSIQVAPAFVSQAFRPQNDFRVGIDQLRQEFATCDAALEPERCALFDALFGWGEVAEREFPEAMATFP